MLLLQEVDGDRLIAESLLRRQSVFLRFGWLLDMFGCR